MAYGSSSYDGLREAALERYMRSKGPVWQADDLRFPGTEFQEAMDAREKAEMEKAAEDE